MEYSVRRSPRARRVRVAVAPDGAVEVVLPERAPARRAAEAVRELSPWIERRRAEAALARAAVAARGDALPFLGEELALVREAGRSRVRRAGGRLLVPAGDPTEALERWYRRQARVEIAPRLDRAVAALGCSYSTLTVRGQRTRWGSCSATGSMSFNWRLMLAPEEVLEYVIWHEACHLVVLDHSSRFWELLGAHLPDYRGPKRWLRDHGRTLVL